MKKYLTLFLAALMILSVLTAASCGDVEKDPGASTSAHADNPDLSVAGANTTEAVVFPDRNYGDEPFTVYMRSRDAGSYRSMYIDVEDSGDVVDNAVFKRNSMVEDKYGIKFEYREATNPEGTVQSDIRNGDVNYDIILAERNTLYDKIISGTFQDFNKLNIDLTKPWWDKNCVDGYSIKGRQYVMVNDVSVSKFNNAYFLYFNKEIVKSFKLEDPYTLFNNDEWLFEKFLEQVKGVSDVRPEGEMGTYGMLWAVGSSNGTHMECLVGCGVQFTGTTQDGGREVVVAENIEKMTDIFDKLRVIDEDDTVALDYDQAVAFDPENSSNFVNKYDHARDLFAQGHFLYLHGSLGVSAQFTEMKDDYGVIVNPKYNKDQTGYYHKVDPYALIWAIPNIDSVDLERLSVIMDYWSYISGDTVIPAYYDITIKTKRVSDPTSSAMVDLMRESICYEFSDVFKLNVDTYVHSGYTSGNVQKSLDSGANPMKKSLQNLMTRLEKIK